MDFDGVYRTKPPPSHYIVLAHDYFAEWVVNVHQYSGEHRKRIIEDLELYLVAIEEEIDIELDASRIYIFDCFALPLGNWVHCIREICKSKEVSRNTEFIFSSYSNNSRIFVFEAEALEPSSMFMYRPGYQFPYYLRNYLSSNGYNNLTFEKTYTLRAKLSYYIRGLVALSFKTFQILLYKVLIRQRSFFFDQTCTDRSPRVIFLSRSVVQSQFVQQLYNLKESESIVVLNESSRRFFRNRRFALEKSKDFLYAEGFISFLDLVKELIRVGRGYNKRCVTSNRLSGIEVPFDRFIPEITVKHYHLRTYSKSVKNCVSKYLNFSNGPSKIIVSFEMLAPFAHFVKISFLNSRVFQIQAALVAMKEFPNYSYADKFYYTDAKLFDYNINSENQERIGLLRNLKYLGLERKKKNLSIKSIVYFAQPVYIDEEADLIEYLRQLSISMNSTFSVKLHPRSKALGARRKYDIIDKDMDSIDVINDTDLVVTRNSSIGLDCWILNTPVLFMVNKSVKGSDVSYIPEDYLGTIKHDKDLTNLKSRIPQILGDFYSHTFHKLMSVDQEEILSQFD